jgi:hypothetical protein
LKPRYPVETYGLFTAVAGQQVYDLYNAVLRRGDAARGLSRWPADHRDRLEPEWAFLQRLGVRDRAVPARDDLLPGGLSVYTFATPNDWWMWDANWASFVNRFGVAAVRACNNLPGSPVRIFPVPVGGEKVFVRFTRARTEAELRADDESWFLTLVQSECAYTIHRKLNAVAGNQDRDALPGWQERPLLEDGR